MVDSIPRKPSNKRAGIYFSTRVVIVTPSSWLSHIGVLKSLESEIGMRVPGSGPSKGEERRIGRDGSWERASTCGHCEEGGRERERRELAYIITFFLLSSLPCFLQQPLVGNQHTHHHPSSSSSIINHHLSYISGTY